ncbi:MAG: T9SS type A sorting domain-containing protein [Bacteroidia bacterium]
MKHKRFYLLLIVILVFNGESFAQCLNKILGNYMDGATPARFVLDTENTGSGAVFLVYFDTDTTPGRIGGIDTSNCTINGCVLYNFHSGDPNLRQGSQVSISPDYDTITNVYWIYNDFTGIKGGNDTEVYIRVETGIKNIVNNIKIKSWPNPVTDNLHYTINCAGPEVEVRLFNMMGECVYRRTAKTAEYNSEQAIDMQSFASGMYLLQISGGQYASSNKIIKQ